MKKCALILLLCLPPVATAKKKEVPHAPLPSQVVQAKTVFVVNAGGSSLAFDELYAEMKQWGRYQIVDSPDAADLVISLQYWVEKNGSSAVPVTNTYTGSTTYYSHENLDPQLRLTIIDPKTKVELWTSIDHRRLARLSSNREKETIKSVSRLVEELKSRSH